MPFVPMPNPYQKTAVAAATPAPQNANMGRQSQQCVSNTKRKDQLAAHNNPKKKRKGDQATLFGQVAFDSERDCEICRAQLHNLRVPHRGHHNLCIMNKKTKGKGELSALEIANREDDKRYQHLTRPIEAKEKGSFKYLTPQAGLQFFNPETYKKKKSINSKTASTSTTMTTPTPPVFESTMLSQRLCEAVTGWVTDADFCAKHKTTTTPCHDSFR
jgi:hypothetical protein